MENTPAPHQALFMNLRELVRAYQAAHDSVLRMSWKKMWPFTMFLPQVDFLRVIRILERTHKDFLDQSKAARKFQEGTQDLALREFYQNVPAYADALAKACVSLQRIASFKQESLEGNPPSRKDFMERLNNYKADCRNFNQHAPALRKCWVAVNAISRQS